MNDLIFREKDHVYLLEGDELPCVSDLCRFISREIYKDAPLWQMEAAAARGTAVHVATQDLDTIGHTEIAEEHLQYLKAYKAFLKEHDVSWTMIEQSLYHPQQRYAGTIDRYGNIDNHAALVEIKTTYQVHKPLCRAQTNLYRMMLMARGYPVDRMYVLHLKRDGKYRLVPMEIDEGLANALITLHNALQKKRRKRHV